MSPCRRPQQRCVPQPRAFTLIELLVVISVIALLISILLPALSAARETAQAIQCASGLRQAMIGIFMYADDHDGVPPYSYWADSNAFDPPSAYRNYASALASYHVADPEVFFCPKQPAVYLGYMLRLKNENIDRRSSYWAYLAYGANRFGFMPREVDAARPNLHQIAVPSDLIGLAEGRESAAKDGVMGDMRPGSTIRLLAMRHPGQTDNMAYVDGHIERPDPRTIGFDPDAGPLGAWITPLSTLRARSPWWENRWDTP